MDELFEYSDSLNAPFEAFKGDWKVVKPHWHYFTEMVYLVKGKLIAEVEGKVYTMSPGDMITFFPKQIHAFVDYPENKFSTSVQEESEATETEILFYVLKFDKYKCKSFEYGYGR